MLCRAWFRRWRGGGPLLLFLSSMSVAYPGLAFPLAAGEHDTALRQQLAGAGVAPLAPLVAEPGEMVDLGRSLFFDNELSGNRNISCASCHHPSMTSGDSRSLPAGTDGEGLGPNRIMGEGREIVPRNAPEVFHRGDPQWNTMFWDSRVSEENQQFASPAGNNLPSGLKNVLAVQAMFPVTSRAEMRGDVGDVDIHGRPNELAAIADDDLPGIWNALMNRLLAVPEYEQAFAAAYPDVPPEQLGFEHVANAIAAFEEAAFSPRDSAFDRYLAGDDDALTAAAKRGAQHFYSGGCASCHAGNLFTDQQAHNLGVPQLGPGKDPATGLDPGRALETGETADEFAFRTPPLRNVMLTGPWMHNGAYTTMEDTLLHKYDPSTALANYDVNQLDELLRSTVRLDPHTVDMLTQSLDPRLPIGEQLSEQQMQDMMAFLFSLTSPSVDEMLQLTPTAVPSGLEVDRLPPSEVAVLYDPASGELQIDGPAALTLDALFLRVSDSEDGPAAFAFATGAAPWALDEDIVLSNTVTAQSFVDYRKVPLFTLDNGDLIPGLLPPGLTDGDIASHLTAAYRLHGSPVLWLARVGMVPEPNTLGMFFIGLWGCMAWVRKQRTA